MTCGHVRSGFVPFFRVCFAVAARRTPISWADLESSCFETGLHATRRDTGATSLATASCNGQPAVSAAEPGSGGRHVYLGMIFLGSTSAYGNTGLRAGDADQLIEQAFAWAGACVDEDEDGVSSCAGDCDDTDPSRFPGNTEICDGIDNDCDEVVPDIELDLDADGVATCEGDCDDGDENRFPGNTEDCDGVDNDCDDMVPPQELDTDADGYRGCESDCDDADASRFPGNPEVCDDVDNDCNDEVDDGLDFFDVFPDADGDGYGDAAGVSSVCEQPIDTLLEAGDCDDSSAAVHPGAEEIKGNGIDEDCDGEDLGGCGCTSVPAGNGAGFVALLWILTRVRRRSARQA